MDKVIAIALLLVSTQASALGDTEEGILYGLGIYKLYDIITEQPEWEPGQIYGSSSEFPPFRCRGDSIKCSYERGLYEREREEWEDEKQKAYECGRTGRNCK
jgi:hypothetical protein